MVESKGPFRRASLGRTREATVTAAVDGHMPGVRFALAVTHVPGRSRSCDAAASMIRSDNMTNGKGESDGTRKVKEGLGGQPRDRAHGHRTDVRPGDLQPRVVRAGGRE